MSEAAKRMAEKFMAGKAIRIDADGRICVTYAEWVGLMHGLSEHILTKIRERRRRRRPGRFGRGSVVWLLERPSGR